MIGKIVVGNGTLKGNIIKGERDILIKASAALRNGYATISALFKETKEPIYITQNGEGDLVLVCLKLEGISMMCKTEDNTFASDEGILIFQRD